MGTGGWNRAEAKRRYTAVLRTGSSTVMRSDTSLITLSMVGNATGLVRLKTSRTEGTCFSRLSKGSQGSKG